MEITQRLVMENAKTPFDEIPITDLGLPVREYNACLHKNITTVRKAFNLVQMDDNSPLKTSLSRLIYILERALDHQGYLDGAALDYHHLNLFENRLAWIAQTQESEGCWAHNPDYTIGATLSFIRAGHTSTQGEYAPVVMRAVRWLEQAFSGPHSRFSDDALSPREKHFRSLARGRSLKNSTIAYGLLCVLAENYDMPRPVAPFEPPPNTDFKSVIEARRWALLIGNAPLYGWSEGGWNMIYDDEEECSSNHFIEFAWITVGAPRPTAR
jgi:hypothetical protein